MHTYIFYKPYEKIILFSTSSEKFTRFCQWKNLELNIQVNKEMNFLLKNIK